MVTEVLVVGGGPAGSAVATRLAEAGRDVLLIEREAGPTDKVCGEFLSPEAVGYLGALGVDVSELGAVPIATLRVCLLGHVAQVALPFAAQSLSRRVLDEQLLGRAVAAGACVRRGVRVQELTQANKGWVARLPDGEQIVATTVFLATGKHDLRAHRRPPGTQGDLVAFKWNYRLSEEQTRALSGCVELVLFDGGYAGLQSIEGGHANLCLVVRRRRLALLGGTGDGARGDELLRALSRESPHLRERLQHATPCWPRPLALSPIPYGHVQRDGDGLYHLGDQAAVIPSFTGEGMSIALHSAELAAGTYLQGGDAGAFQRLLAKDVARQMWRAVALSEGLVRPLGQALIERVALLFPSIVARTAVGTRLPPSALERARRAGLSRSQHAGR
jgi:menaquinone-9 beta-reductase